MILSKQSQESLEVIRFKVERQQYDFKGIEAQCLSQVFEEIQWEFCKKKVTLNISCSGCLKTAVNVVLNYINTHEEKTNLVPANVTEIRVMDVKIDSNLKAETVFRNATLSELRLMHPHIKATSVKVFIQKLEDERGI